MNTVDIEENPLSRCRTEGHSGRKEFYQVTPENTYSVLNAPDDTWNKIIRKVAISEHIMEVEVRVPAIAHNCKPGQFVIVRATERGERIPLTIGDFDRVKGTITMVIQSVGNSSREINAFSVGDRYLDIVGPLGHPSEIKNFGTVVMVAGGVGVAPVYPIQRALHAAGNHVISIFGARNKDLVFWEDKMRACADEVYITTDDGSYGEKGFVTTVLQRLIDEGRKIDRCVAIGPGIMMKMVSNVTKGEPRTDAARATACLPIPTIVSLNTIMVDGTGMCSGCSVRVHGKNKFACVDGPEFDAHGVDWDMLAVRMRTYREQESLPAGQMPSTPGNITPSKMRVPMPEQDPEYRATNFFEVALGYTEEMAQAEAARCLNCSKPACRSGCPVTVNIPAFIRKVVEKDYHGAYDIITRTNACPGISGRVCPQELQCESKCILGDGGMGRGAIAIGRLERFVADYVRTHPREPKSQTRLYSGARCAVVGSGPAGIACAAALADKGHRVTMFEALHAAGGVCTYGIPEFRLPKEIVRKEVERLSDLEDGKLVEVRLNTPIGQCGTIRDLLDSGFDSVFIGTGAGLPRALGVPGEDLPGVYSANEYLTRTNLMKAYQFPEKSDTPVLVAPSVVVVGGGNVACDVARCARRFGANVTMVYRRPQSQMPARAEEIHHAIQEGIIVKEQFNPVEVIANCEGTGVKGVLAVRMDNSNGQCKPIPGTEELVPCSMVVVAIGNMPNPLIPQSMAELVVHRGGLIKTDENGMTSVPGVFAAGDIVTGAATVIKALGAGREAGMKMDEWMKANKKGDAALAGKPVRPGLPVVDAEGTVVAEAEPEVEEVPAGDDVSSNSVHIHLDKCVGCSACVRACDSQGMCILEMDDNRRPTVRVGTTLAESNCMSCGRCASVCPTGAIAAAPATERVVKNLAAGAPAKVALVAPSCKVGFHEALNRVPGNGEAALISALRNMGFTHVFDVQTAADLTIIEETTELLERLNTPEKLPLLTSCCPAWVNLIEQDYPDLVKNLSSARSPNAMAAPVARKLLAKAVGCKPEDVYVVSVMPCIAKKDEIRREQLHNEVNEVLTVREVADHVKAKKIALEHARQGFDPLMEDHSGGSIIFGATGGVMEAALRTAARRLGIAWTDIDYTPVRGLTGVKEAEITLGDAQLRVCIAHGGSNLRNVLDGIQSGSRHYDFVEGMACPGGCVGGAGNPRAIRPDRLAERAKVLYDLDIKEKITSDENPYAQVLLADMTDDERHHCLHTSFSYRPKKVAPK